MKKAIIAFIVMVLMNSCRREPPLSPVQPDTPAPTLSYPITSFASVQRFYPFGDTANGKGANKGYEILLFDTNTAFQTACPGVVISITPNSAGTSNVLVQYQSHSAYSFMYGGVRNVQVHVNDSLQAGAILGEIGSVINFSVIHFNNTVLCPANYGSQGFNNSIQVAISQSNMLNPADTVNSPCITESLPF